MRSFAKLMLWLGLAALCLVLSPGLVQSSEAQAPPQESPLLAAIICRDADVPIPTAASVPQQQVQPKWTAVVTVVPQEPAPHTVLCDGNGWPLSGRIWAREAWAANPPQGIPGS